MKETFVQSIILLIVCYVMATLQLYSDSKFVGNNGIYDIVFSNISYVSTIDTNYFLVSYLIVFIIYLLNQSKQKILKISKEVMFILSWALFIRAIIISMTVFPSSAITCIPKNYSFYECMLYAPLRMSGVINSCTDKIYSGHMSLATILLCSWVKNFKNYKYIPKIFTVLVMFSSILERKHYTVDMVLAFIVNFLVYNYFQKI